LDYSESHRGAASLVPEAYRETTHPALLPLLLAPLFAHSQDKSRIVALENSWNQAELHNDAHAVDLLLADDFVMTVADGYTPEQGPDAGLGARYSYRP